MAIRALIDLDLSPALMSLALRDIPIPTTGGAMSTSQGPRGGRGRGRGGATSIQKGNRAGSVLKAGGRAAAPLTTTPRGPSTRQYKPPPTQSASHDPIKRSSPSPARGGRGGSPPRSSRISTSPPDQEARRNPGSRNVGGIVSRRMEDVYQRVRELPSCAD